MSDVIKTYPEMNYMIVEFLRMSCAPHQLYAAQRIEELEKYLADAQKQMSAAHEDYKIQNAAICELQDKLAIARDGFAKIRSIVVREEYFAESINAAMFEIATVAKESLERIADGRQKQDRTEGWRTARSGILRP